MTIESEALRALEEAFRRHPGATYEDQSVIALATLKSLGWQRSPDSSAELREGSGKAKAVLGPDGTMSVYDRRGTLVFSTGVEH